MRFWLLVATLVVFSAGIATGVFVSRSYSKGPQGRFPGGQFDLGPDSLVPTLSSETVYARLGLSDQQRGLIDYLVSNQKKRVSDVRKQLSEMSTDFRATIAHALTAEQSKKLDDLLAELEQGMIRRGTEREIEQLKMSLELSATELSCIEPALLDYAQKKGALMRGGRISFGDPAFSRLREERDAALAKCLSPEKLAKYKELKERQRGRGGPGGPGRREGPPGAKPQPDGPAPAAPTDSKGQPCPPDQQRPK